MSDRIEIEWGARAATEEEPAQVLLSVKQGVFGFLAIMVPEEARTFCAGGLDAANSAELGYQDPTLAEDPEERGRVMADMFRQGLDISRTVANAQAPHPCVHCGAEDNYRCCEFGRDKK